MKLITLYHINICRDNHSSGEGPFDACMDKFVDSEVVILIHHFVFPLFQVRH